MAMYRKWGVNRASLTNIRPDELRDESHRKPVANSKCLKKTHNTFLPRSSMCVY